MTKSDEHWKKHELDLINRLTKFEPSELIPVNIPLDINVRDDIKSNYQILIDFESNGLNHFLLRYIHSRFLTGEIRLIRNSQLYYSAPGWLHCEHPETQLEPCLYMQKNDQWMFTVDYDPFKHSIRPQINFVLRGYRVRELK